VSTALTAAKHPSRKRPKKKVVKGTAFTFTLSEDAVTRIAITQRL
jgi:hypothetical protein